MRLEGKKKMGKNISRFLLAESQRLKGNNASFLESNSKNDFLKTMILRHEEFQSVQYSQ